MEIKENMPLAHLTTFQIGGLARFFISAQSFEDIQMGLKFAKDSAQPVFILGGGSNLLVSDKGYDGLVIKIELAGVTIEDGESADTKTVIAAAGERWDVLVERACSEGLWGIENLSNIPGTVGGAVVQNIGAYGAALSETLVWVEVLDSATGEIKNFTNAECAFEYRDSTFKHHGNLIVLRAAFNLSTSPKPNISYKDLAARFTLSEVEWFTDIGAVRDAVIGIRQGKFPDLSLEGTAGSFFKNPIVTADEAALLKQMYPDIPLFAMPETSGVKVPLAWLLDHILNLKGASIGGARLFEKQPLVIAATFGTPASNVAMLAEKIKKEVKEKLHLEIEEEVKIV